MNSIISFNASTSDKQKLYDLGDVPFQIMPGGRSSLSTSDISKFKEMKNENILIHSSYITRPFNSEISNITKVNLQNYSVLAHKLGTQDILIHMPSSISELQSFAIGIEAINKYIIENKCICHLETNPLTKDLIQLLKIDKSNAFKIYNTYTDTLWKSIPEKIRDKFRIVVDTAHLYANGLTIDQMIEYIEKWKKNIKYIHFNGNANSIFTRDLHVPMYSERNKFTDIEKLSNYVSKNKFILIAEDSTIKGTYDEWKNYCEKYGLEIVKYSEILSI